MTFGDQINRLSMHRYANYFVAAHHAPLSPSTGQI